MRFTKCDGPDCKIEVKSRCYIPDRGWISVEADEDADHGQFCSWICLAAWARNKAVDQVRKEVQ